MGLLFFRKNTFLGIDIGSSSIKVIEMSFSGKNPKLENFGAAEIQAIADAGFTDFKKDSFYLSSEKILSFLNEIFFEARLESKVGFFSLPDFTTFFTYFEIPNVPKEEIPSMVKTEAKRHIPLPLSEVVLDWKIIEDLKTKPSKLKVLLVAVPNEIVQQYRFLGESLKLSSFSLEAEAFSLARVYGREGETLAIFDFGAKTSSCTIVENKTMKYSFSIELGGNSLTEKIARTFGTTWEDAEEIKKEFGIKEGKEKLREILIPSINGALEEGNRIIQEFERRENKEVKRVILAGGGANLPGLLDYAKLTLRKEVEIGFPFSQIIYPQSLQEYLRENGSIFSIAVGLALKGKEK